jgi:hypothetical protein
MHRVGLQDEVIINALRARYHPFKLTNDERAELEKDAVSAAVIAAIEDPLSEAAAVHATPPFVAPAAPLKNDPKTTAAVVPPTPTTTTTPKTVAVVVPPVPSSKPSPSAPPPIGGKPAPTTAELLLPENMRDYTRTGDSNTTPSTPGIYRRINGGGWAPIATEAITWKHNEENSAKGVRGLLTGKACGTATTAGAADFLVVMKPGESIVQVQLLRVRADHLGRAFTPTFDGASFGGAENSAAVPYDPQKLGPKVWLVSLHNLPEGDYGFLPPNQSDLRSTTGFAQAIYTFHVL